MLNECYQLVCFPLLRVYRKSHLDWYICYMFVIAIPKLPKPSLVRLYYQFTPPPRHRRFLTTKCSQARPGASKPARDSTFGIQEALGS